MVFYKTIDVNNIILRDIKELRLKSINLLERYLPIKKKASIPIKQ